jgi:hypothetical protein
LALGTGLQKKADCYGTYVPHEKKIMSDFTFFDVREALGKKIVRSFSTSQILEENYIFFDVREALGKKVIRSS